MGLAEAVESLAIKVSSSRTISLERNAEVTHPGHNHRAGNRARQAYFARDNFWEANLTSYGMPLPHRGLYSEHRTNLKMSEEPIYTVINLKASGYKF